MKEIATLAGGCFWCLEAVYDRMKGIEAVESGYIGGEGAQPTYETVCTGRTRPPAAGQITVHPTPGSPRGPLRDLFSVHDPPPLHTPGPHARALYRSAA